MKIKKYAVESMKDAIAKIREELGPDAVILHSRKMTVAGKGGMKHPMFEVTAAIEEHEAKGNVTGRLEQSGKKPGKLARLFGDIPEEINQKHEDHSVDFLIDDDKDEAELNSSAHLSHDKSIRRKRSVGRTRDPEAVPKTSIRLSEMHQAMLENNVDEMIAESLVKTAMEEKRISEGGDAVREFLPRSLENFITCSGPLDFSVTKPKIVALVGPTGVGKTTTVAKLAMNYSVLKGKSVALIAVDIQRAAAVQQLKSYADMLQVPFETVLNPGELRRSVKSHLDKDLILIDTAGRNPYKWISILELAAFFKGIDNAEIHLAISAARSLNENLGVVERFGALSISRLLFTKVDEIRDYGVIVNIAATCRKPISYLTTGQTMPDDIEVATCERILELVSKPKEEKR